MFPRKVLKEMLSGRLKMHPNVPDAVCYFISYQVALLHEILVTVNLVISNQVALLHEILVTVNLVILKNPYLVAF